MKFLIVFLMAISTIFASILDQNFITVSNDEVIISNEAAFYAYITQLNDSNLTASYQKAAAPINRLYNPFEEKLNVATYEDAFSSLRFFYQRLYDANSSKCLDTRIVGLKAQKALVIAELLASNRKRLSDTSIVSLVVTYTQLVREIDLLSLNKSNMDIVAKQIVHKIWEKEYAFAYNEQNLTVQAKTLQFAIQNEHNSATKAILQNNLITLNYQLNFISTIKDLQQIQATGKWKDNQLSPKEDITQPIILDISQTNHMYSEYLKSLDDANASTVKTKLNQEIINEIFSFYKRPAWQIQADYFLNQLLIKTDETMDYTLFIFDNNNVQVSDIFDFLKVAIIALIAQWLIIWFLHNKMNYGSSHLSVFIIKIVVLCYLIYDFATQVLNLNPTNLTIFASAFSLAFGFGMQSIIQNFVAGLIMIGEKTVKTGDSITLADGRSGIVTNVNYRTTTLKTDDNCLIMVPNSKVFLETIENKTKLDPKVRVKIVFLVDKDADFEQMEVILKNACNDIAGFIDEPAPELTISSITKDGVNVEFRLHVKNSDYADTQVITRKLYARLLEESVKR